MKKTLYILSLMALSCVAAQAAIQIEAEEGSLQEGLAFYWNFDGTESDYQTATGETITLSKTQLAADSANRISSGGVDNNGYIKSWTTGLIDFQGDISNAEIAAGSFTLSFKACAYQHTWRNLIGFSIGDSTYTMQLGNGHVYLFEGSEYTTRITLSNAASDITGSDWANIVLVSDGSSLTLYVNDTSGSYTFTPADGAVLNGFRLAQAYPDAAASSRDSDARYDDLAIWNRALTATEVSYLTNGGVAAGAAIPEPATTTLSLLALAGLAARRRRK